MEQRLHAAMAKYVCAVCINIPLIKVGRRESVECTVQFIGGKVSFFADFPEEVPRVTSFLSIYIIITRERANMFAIFKKVKMLM